MLNAIIRFSVRNKLLIGLFTLAWIVWGLFEFSKLSIDALPDVTSNQVQIITTSPTLGAPEVERLITFPLEQACSNINGIKEIRSISRFGLSVVTVVFNDETDIYWARQQVSERLIRVKEDIPSDAGIPELAPLTTGLGEIYQYILKPAKGYEGKISLYDLRSIQDWIVRRQLLGTKGVADVSSFGGNLKQYEVAVRTDKLFSHGIAMSELFQALEGNNQNSGGAYIEKGPSLLFIRTEGLAGNIEEIGNIFIKKTAAGIPVYVKDVAEVRIGKAVRYGAMTYGDEGEVAGAVVLMLKGENASEVVTAVKEKIEKIRSTLPEGVILETFYDRTKMVNRSISTVKKNLAEGALIVVFILVLFLGNLRAGLIVASVIPMAMLFAIGLMNLFGVSGNLMSLGALDFGLIVDGAVIIVEAVMHRLYHRHLYNRKISQEEMDDAVYTSSSRMMNAAVFGQVIILIVYLPILSLTGIEGKMFRPMAQTVTFALLGAFILSLTYVPMLSSIALSKKVKEHKTFSDKMMEKVQSIYSKTLEKIFSFPKSFVLLAVAILVFSLFIATRLGGEFIPKLEEGDFAVDARLMPGTSLSATIDNSIKAAAILQRFPEVEKIVTRIGSSEIPTDPMPVEMTDIMVTLKDKETWTSAESFDELANKMSDSLKNIPGFTTGFQYPVQMRFNELVAGARQDVVCKLFGENLDSLASMAGRMGEIISRINGAEDIYVETVTGLPQIVIKYNRQLMSMHQINIADVNRIIRASFAGEAAGKVYENERRYDLVLRMDSVHRKDLEDVRSLLVPTPNGIQLPLEQFADIRVEDGPNQIQREDAKRRVIVGFNARGRDVQSIVEEVQKKMEAVDLPAGYYIQYGGQFKNPAEAKKRLSIAVPIALVLIFLMLYFAFDSLKYGLLIFSAIPFSAIGGVLSLWLRDMAFSISAGIGFIALFGVAVLNGIVLITEFNILRKDGIEDAMQIIREGTVLRLRPVLMTAFVASLGFLPMAVSQSAGAEVQRPLATVVIGGLITATLLTLFMLPLLYYWTERKRKNKIPLGAASMLLIFLGISSQVKSQTRVPLDSFLNIATRQNLSLEISRKGTEYYNALQEKTFYLPKTQLNAEYGNINSFKKDTRISINQTFLLPTVYKAQKDLFSSQWETAIAGNKVIQNELYKEVRLNYYAMHDVLLRKQLLQILDTAYRQFLDAASLRYKTGETNLLEKTAAESQLEQFLLQMKELDADLIVLQEKNKFLLRTDQSILPVIDTSVQSVQKNLSTVNPLIDYWQRQYGVAEAQIKMDKTALLPDVNLGYNNLSIAGWQSTDGVNQKFFSTSNRFNTVNIGINLPIGNSATRSKLKAGAVNKEISQMQIKLAEEQLMSKKLQLTEELKKQEMSLDYYRKTGLSQANLIMNNAILSYRNGELNYMEWIALLNQALKIKLGYLDALKAYQMANTELAYIQGN